MNIRDFEDFLRYPDKEVLSYLKRNRHKYCFGRQEPFNLIKSIGRFGNYIHGHISAQKKPNTRFYISDLVRLDDSNYCSIKQDYINKINLSINSTSQLNVILCGMLDSLYGSNRYSIEHSIERLILTVHYPEIEISNTLGMTRTLYDIFIEYRFIKTRSIVILHSISFNRTSFTKEEIYYKYSFSHANHNPGGNWTAILCFGSTGFFKSINALKTSNVTSNDLFQLFLGINNYLSWESIEGTPYKYLSAVKNYKTSDYGIPINTNKLTTTIINTIDSFKYKFNVDNGKLNMTIPNDYRDELYDKLNTSLREDSSYRGYYCNVSSNGCDCIISNLDNVILDSTNVVYFKDKEFIPKIIPSNEEPCEIEEQLSRRTFNVAMKEIEEKFTNHFIEEYA